VEVGELSAVNVMQMASVTLPGITVTAARGQTELLADATVPMLPEVVVVAARDLRLADTADASELSQG
jgi:hypothetical protein